MLTSTANAFIKIGDSYDSSVFILGDIIDSTYVELIPKVTKAQMTALSKTSLERNFKVYNTTDKKTYSWTGVWTAINDATAAELVANTAGNQVIIDVSNTGEPSPGDVLTATSSNSAIWAPATGGGGVSDANYIHNQVVPSNTWVIIHALGKYPSVMVIDSADSVIIGDITYDSISQITVSFTSSFAGKAYLN